MPALSVSRAGPSPAPRATQRFSSLLRKSADPDPISTRSIAALTEVPLVEVGPPLASPRSTETQVASSVASAAALAVVETPVQHRPEDAALAVLRRRQAERCAARGVVAPVCGTTVPAAHAAASALPVTSATPVLQAASVVAEDTKSQVVQPTVAAHCGAGSSVAASCSSVSVPHEPVSSPSSASLSTAAAAGVVVAMAATPVTGLSPIRGSTAAVVVSAAAAGPVPCGEGVGAVDASTHSEGSPLGKMSTGSHGPRTTAHPAVGTNSATAAESVVASTVSYNLCISGTLPRAVAASGASVSIRAPQDTYGISSGFGDRDALCLAQQSACMDVVGRCDVAALPLGSDEMETSEEGYDEAEADRRARCKALQSALVDSVTPAAGSSFAPLQQGNATGTQRLKDCQVRPSEENIEKTPEVKTDAEEPTKVSKVREIEQVMAAMVQETVQGVNKVEMKTEEAATNPGEGDDTLRRLRPLAVDRPVGKVADEGLGEAGYASYSLSDGDVSPQVSGTDPSDRPGTRRGRRLSDELSLGVEPAFGAETGTIHGFHAGGIGVSQEPFSGTPNVAPSLAQTGEVMVKGPHQDMELAFGDLGCCDDDWSGVTLIGFFDSPVHRSDDQELLLERELEDQTLAPRDLYVILEHGTEDDRESSRSLSTRGSQHVNSLLLELKDAKQLSPCNASAPPTAARSPVAPLADPLESIAPAAMAPIAVSPAQASLASLPAQERPPVWRTDALCDRSGDIHPVRDLSASSGPANMLPETMSRATEKGFDRSSAVRIQAWFRGVFSRRHKRCSGACSPSPVVLPRVPQATASTESGSKSLETTSEEAPRESAVLRAARGLAALRAQASRDRETLAASRLQATWRGYRIRRELCTHLWNSRKNCEPVSSDRCSVVRTPRDEASRSRIHGEHDRESPSRRSRSAGDEAGLAQHTDTLHAPLRESAKLPGKSSLATSRTQEPRRGSSAQASRRGGGSSNGGGRRHTVWELLDMETPPNVRAQAPAQEGLPRLSSAPCGSSSRSLRACDSAAVPVVAALRGASPSASASGGGTSAGANGSGFGKQSQKGVRGPSPPPRRGRSGGSVGGASVAKLPKAPSHGTAAPPPNRRSTAAASGRGSCAGSGCLHFDLIHPTMSSPRRNWG
eukprot:TRINITY_DN11586_c0_g1_i4.p1 TRINITY_DN11586_c0_g1~~TRINITY_DN11586_c0_g1_i4.p1  ORF type:complete len:1211 (-),score=177.63 TRINITY_DN11586_c0_g1_i4:188-3610(-)